MINEKVAALLNEQINKELYSAYLYWDMSNYFDNRGLDGFAKWYMVQAHEELDHALHIYRFMQDNDIPITLLTIEQPNRRYDNPLDVLNTALEHEEYVTNSIHAIYNEADGQHDLRTMEFLHWFINEQAEEETNARNLVTKLRIFANDGKGLYLLNQELGERE